MGTFAYSKIEPGRACAFRIALTAAWELRKMSEDKAKAWAEPSSLNPLFSYVAIYVLLDRISLMHALPTSASPWELRRPPPAWRFF